ncbi:hypothetical protein NST50_15170 [Paenibacillus sp. FSL E2-0202]|uniref:hypothetical protein n=1 Tax=Paenibacillus sp. FSL E2-0202 TaxID=2954505 RepID=UPI0030EE2F35
MTKGKGWIAVLFLLFSLVFVGITHQGTMFGDYLFRTIGIPPWSEPATNHGLHYSAIFGIILLIFSGNLTIMHFKQRYKKYVGRTVILFFIIFYYLYPFLTERLYYFVNMNNEGIEVVDFLEKDSHCMYGTQEDMVEVQCTIRLINYGGKNETIMIRPIFREYGNPQGIWSFAEVQPQEITLLPRSNIRHHIYFESKPDARIAEFGADGNTDYFGVEFVKDGQKKVVFRE